MAGLLRAVITVGVGAVGTLLGTVVGALLLQSLGAPPGTGALLGLLAGLVGGWLLARQTYPRRER